MIGTIERVHETGWRRAGSFRVAKDGTIERAPKWLREAGQQPTERGEP